MPLWDARLGIPGAKAWKTFAEVSKLVYHYNYIKPLPSATLRMRCTPRRADKTEAGPALFAVACPGACARPDDHGRAPFEDDGCAAGRGGSKASVFLSIEARTPPPPAAPAASPS